MERRGDEIPEDDIQGAAVEREDMDTPEQTATPVTSSTLQPSVPSTQQRKRAREATQEQSNMMQTAGQHWATTPDEYDYIGYNIARKMRRMTERQRIHFERILADVSAKGLYGELDGNTVVASQRQLAPPHWKRTAQRCTLKIRGICRQLESLLQHIDELEHQIEESPPS